MRAEPHLLPRSDEWRGRERREQLGCFYPQHLDTCSLAMRADGHLARDPLWPPSPLDAIGLCMLFNWKEEREEEKWKWHRRRATRRVLRVRPGLLEEKKEEEVGGGGGGGGWRRRWRRRGSARQSWMHPASAHLRFDQLYFLPLHRARHTPWIEAPGGFKKLTNNHQQPPQVRKSPESRLLLCWRLDAKHLWILMRKVIPKDAAWGFRSSSLSHTRACACVHVWPCWSLISPSPSPSCERRFEGETPASGIPARPPSKRLAGNLWTYRGRVSGTGSCSLPTSFLYFLILEKN